MVLGKKKNESVQVTQSKTKTPKIHGHDFFFVWSSSLNKDKTISYYLVVKNSYNFLFELTIIENVMQEFVFVVVIGIKNDI